MGAGALSGEFSVDFVVDYLSGFYIAKKRVVYWI